MGAHRLATLQARRLLGALLVGELAKLARVDDWVINAIENGGSCQPEITDRILNALGPPVAITSNSQASPTVITTTTAHTFQTGDTVVIAGVATANANPNGTRVVTRISGTQFSVPVDSSIAAGTGGTATIDPASIGIVRLT